MKTTMLSIFILSVLLSISVYAQEATPATDMQIVEAKLGKDVADRVLTGEDSVFTKGSKAYLWMKITGGSQQEITVTWTTGTATHGTTLVVGGSPWRTWASKTVGKAGDWTVTITDNAGKTLKAMSFKVE